MSESILNNLRDDHRNISMLIEQIQVERDVAQKKDLYLQFKTACLLHMEAEELTIYNHLIEDVYEDEAEETAQHCTQDHFQIKQIITYLDNLSIENPEWDMTFQSLKEKIETHIEEEETTLFEEVKQDFSRDELLDFGEEFEDTKSSLSSQI